MNQTYWHLKKLTLILFIVAISIKPCFPQEFKCSTIRTSHTEAIQKAFNSGNFDKIIFDNSQGRNKYNIGPIIIRPNNKKEIKEIVLEEGVTVEALSGAYPNIHEHCVFKLIGCSNVRIYGKGSDARIKMLINEYNEKDGGEWRHCISLKSCNNITIEKLTVEKSGGDGIYLGIESGNSQNYNSNIVIKNVICNGNARNGISIISAKNVEINNCTIRNTGLYNPPGLAKKGPWAGIDIEPNYANEVIQDILIKNSTFISNKNMGIMAAPCNLRDTSQSIGITIDSNRIINSYFGINLLSLKASHLDGYIHINNCTVENPNPSTCFYKPRFHSGINVYNWAHSSLDISFNNCVLINSSKQNHAILFNRVLRKNNSVNYNCGNVKLNNIKILNFSGNSLVTFQGATSKYIFSDIFATILTDKNKVRVEYGEYFKNCNIFLHSKIENGKFIPDINMAKWSDDLHEITITGSSRGNIWNSLENAFFTYVKKKEDFNFKVKLASISGFAKAGIIVRQSTKVGAELIHLHYNDNDKNVTIHARNNYTKNRILQIGNELSSVHLPIYLKVKRVNKTISFFASNDGLNFTKLHNIKFLSDELVIGLSAAYGSGVVQFKEFSIK